VGGGKKMDPAFLAAYSHTITSAMPNPYRAANDCMALNVRGYRRSMRISSVLMMELRPDIATQTNGDR